MHERRVVSIVEHVRVGEQRPELAGARRLANLHRSKQQSVGLGASRSGARPGPRQGVPRRRWFAHQQLQQPG